MRVTEPAGVPALPLCVWMMLERSGAVVSSWGPLYMSTVILTPLGQSTPFQMSRLQHQLSSSGQGLRGAQPGPDHSLPGAEPGPDRRCPATCPKAFRLAVSAAASTE